MKKSMKIAISVSVVVLLVVAVALAINHGNNNPPEVNDVCLFDDYYMYRNSNTNSKFYIKNEEPSLNHTVLQGWIYKYSYDKNNRFVAMRYLWAYKIQDLSEAPESVIYYRWHSGVKYAICEDLFKLYDCKEDKLLDFETENLLNEYCNKNNISLCDWFYPCGNGYSQGEKAEPISGEFSLKKAPYNSEFCSVYKGEDELFFGFVSDVSVEDDVISLRLRQPKNYYSPENMTANSLLSPLTDKPVGEYNNHDIYYDKFIYIYSDRIVEKP